MKKRTSAIIYILIGLLILLIGIGVGILVARNRSKAVIPADNSLGVTYNDPFNESIKTVAGTIPEMLKAEYWLRDDSEKVLFTAEEIADFDYNNPLFIKYTTRNDNIEHYLYMFSLPKTISSEAVLDTMWSDTVQQYVSASKTVYINGELPEEDYWATLEENCAIDQVPEDVEPQYYICLERVVAKILPTDDFAAGNSEEMFINSFVCADIMPFSGVVGLHESADGQWVYVLSGSFCGWVKKNTLAACKNQEEWLSACQPEQFIVVTGSELVMDETAMPTISSGMILPMGTKIRLSVKNPDQVNGRNTYGCYVVEIPYRDTNGMLNWETTLVPVSKDVHPGYLTMTSESVVRQAFKLLGKVYGYGGSLASNDCSGIVCQIFACYGINLPRNSKAIANIADLGSFDCELMTTAKKRSILERMPAGTLLYMDGHLMIYLGSVDGKQYVISSCSSFKEPEPDMTTIKANCVMVSNMDLLRGDGKTWLESITNILWKEY